MILIFLDITIEYSPCSLDLLKPNSNNKCFTRFGKWVFYNYAKVLYWEWKWSWWQVFLKSQGHEETYLTTFSIQSKYYLDLSKFLQNSCKHNIHKYWRPYYLKWECTSLNAILFLTTVNLKGLKLYYVQYILLLRDEILSFQRAN